MYLAHFLHKIGVHIPQSILKGTYSEKHYSATKKEYQSPFLSLRSCFCFCLSISSKEFSTNALQLKPSRRASSINAAYTAGRKRKFARLLRFSSNKALGLRLMSFSSWPRCNPFPVPEFSLLPLRSILHHSYCYHHVKSPYVILCFAIISLHPFHYLGFYTISIILQHT